MKKTFLVIPAFVFLLYSVSVFANGNVYCMGDCGDHHHPGWSNGLKELTMQTEFSGNLDGGSRTHGFGDRSSGSSYSFTEQKFNTISEGNLTGYPPGVNCPGGCAENNAHLKFEGRQEISTGGMHESSGNNRSSAFSNSDATGDFNFRGGLGFD